MMKGWGGGGWCEEMIGERSNISARDNSWVDGLHEEAELEGGEGGHLPPLTPKISLHI